MSAKQTWLKLHPVAAGGIIALGIAALIGIGIYGAGEAIRADKAGQEIVWGPGSCPVTDTTLMGDLVVSCDEKKYRVRADGIKLRYALNPGPLNCGITRRGYPICELRPFKPTPADAK